MTTSNAAENKLLDWIDIASRELEGAQTALEDAQVAYNAAATDLTSLKRSLEFGRSREATGSSGIAGVTLAAIAAEETHMDALKLVADRCGGVVRTAEAVNAIKASRRSNAKRRSLYSNLYHLMLDSDEWTREGQGAFRLLQSDGVLLRVNTASDDSLVFTGGTGVSNANTSSVYVSGAATTTNDANLVIEGGNATGIHISGAGNDAGFTLTTSGRTE